LPSGSSLDSFEGVTEEVQEGPIREEHAEADRDH
jgi:hypothetical protein